MANEVGGCFNDCYAAKSATLYGYDFSKTVLRHFDSEYHRRSIVNRINRIPLDFVRMGTSGDPSENWDHTVSIIKGIDRCNKQIVIITKHWTNLSDEQLAYFGTINVCVNTSVSALDKPEITSNGITQYERLKPYCKSILRIVSAKFNDETEQGALLSETQAQLFSHSDTLDTVLRVNKNNPLLKTGTIIAKETTFLGKKALASKHNRNTYFGKCSTCHEMCGVSVTVKEQLYPAKRGITKQLTLFRSK